MLASSLLPSRGCKAAKRELSNNQGFLDSTLCFSASVENVIIKRFLRASLKEVDRLSFQIFSIVDCIASFLIFLSEQILPTKLHLSFIQSFSDTSSPNVILLCYSSDNLSCPHCSSNSCTPSIVDCVVTWKT